MSEVKFPCPACGFLVFNEPAGSYDVCPVCNWEDDYVQLRHPLVKGANARSLFDYQWSVALPQVPLGTTERDEFRRDPAWHPLTREDMDELAAVPKTGQEYFEALSDEPLAYYWRKPQGRTPQ